MRKLEIVDAEVMQVAIRQEIDRSEESRYDHRLHGVLLVASGRSCTEVSQLFGEDATMVQRWVRRFEHHGFAGLRDGERPDGPSCWTGDSGRVCRVTCAAIRIAVVVHSTSGTVRCWLRKPWPQVAQ